MQGQVTRGLEFQRSVTQELRQEVTLPATGKRLLRGMQKPLVEQNVGLIHPGSPALTYADQLVVDEATLEPGTSQVRMETFSNKSHDFGAWSEREVIEQFRADVHEALAKYGGTVQIRRPGHPLFGRNVSVSRVHLVYDAETLTVRLKEQLGELADTSGIDLHFYHAKR